MDTFYMLIEKGGLIMIPILFCSLISVTIIIERAVALKKSRIIPSKLLSMLKDFSDTNKKSILDYCNSKEKPFSKIVKKLLLNSNLNHTEAAEVIKVTGKQETACLDKGLFLLELVAAITPLMGLLGTVLGMIDVFDTIANQGVGQAEALSAGISKALLTTVAGLSVAIPSLAAFSLFSKKVDGLVSQMDRHITVLHSKIYGIKVE